MDVLCNVPATLFWVKYILCNVLVVLHKVKNILCKMLVTLCKVKGILCDVSIMLCNSQCCIGNTSIILHYSSWQYYAKNNTFAAYEQMFKEHNFDHVIAIIATVSR